ncbi:MAG: DUF6350 family protein [Mycobacteriaceae bacterium]
MTALLDRLRPAEPSGLADRVKGALGVAFGPVLTTVAVLVAAVLVLFVAAGLSLSGVPAVVASVWLACHRVPLDVDGTRLGVLPLLPVVLLIFYTRRSVAATGARGRQTWVVLAAAVLGPVCVAALAVAVLASGAGGLPVGAPALPLALLAVAVVHLIGALAGLAGPSGALLQLRRRLPHWAWTGLAQVPLLVAALLAAGAVLVVLALLTSLPTASRLVGEGGSAAGALGLVVLSTAYVPNVVVAATSVLLGPGAGLGHSTVTVFGATGAPVPALPVLAVLPEGSGSWWWMLLLAIPAALATVLGLRCARSGLDRADGLRAVLLAGVGVAAVVAALGWASGGALGKGMFNPVGVPVLGLTLATVGWLAVVGGAAFLVSTQPWRTTPDASVAGSTGAAAAQDATQDDDEPDAETKDAGSDSGAVAPDGSDADQPGP